MAEHHLHCPLHSGMHPEDHCLRSAGETHLCMPVYALVVNKPFADKTALDIPASNSIYLVLM